MLFALVPSGVVLAFDAKGGAIVTAGFLLSAAIVAGCMTYGVRAARRRDLLSHARMMRHVVGQMSVAVTSRAFGRNVRIVTTPSRACAPRMPWGL